MPWPRVSVCCLLIRTHMHSTCMGRPGQMPASLSTVSLLSQVYLLGAHQSRSLTMSLRQEAPLQPHLFLHRMLTPHIRVSSWGQADLCPPLQQANPLCSFPVEVSKHHML